MAQSILNWSKRSYGEQCEQLGGDMDIDLGLSCSHFRKFHWLRIPFVVKLESSVHRMRGNIFSSVFQIDISERNISRLSKSVFRSRIRAILFKILCSEDVSNLVLWKSQNHSRLVKRGVWICENIKQNF